MEKPLSFTAVGGRGAVRAIRFLVVYFSQILVPIRASALRIRASAFFPAHIFERWRQSELTNFWAMKISNPMIKIFANPTIETFE